MSSKYQLHDNDILSLVNYANCKAYTNKSLNKHQYFIQTDYVTSEEDWKKSDECDFYGMKGFVALSYN